MDNRQPEFISISNNKNLKVQIVNNLLKHLQQKRQQKCLILDVDGQYCKIAKEDDVILRLDQHIRHPKYWNFWSNGVPAEFFAETLIGDSGMGNFFDHAGRALLTDLLKINSDIDGLWEDLTSHPKKLSERLKNVSDSSLLLGGSEIQAAGVQATLLSKLAFLQDLDYSYSDNSKVFGISEWCRDSRENWVFLVVKDFDLESNKQLLRLWIELAALEIMQRELNKDYPHFWLIADELAGLGKLPTLGKLLSQGRKYKATALVGSQNDDGDYNAEAEHYWLKALKIT